MKDRTLHVSAVGSQVRKVAERLEVFHGGQRAGHARLFDLEALHLYGRSHLTAAALQACMQSGVRICWYSRTRLVARCEPEAPSHVLTRIAQVDRLRDGPWRLGFSQQLVAAKIASQHALVWRWRQSRSDRDQVTELDWCARELLRLGERVPQTSGDDGVRGLEGMAAATHFRAIAAVLRGSQAEELGFRGRASHPPPDPVNAALSFGYVLLASEMAGLIAGVGLDPAIGLLHGLRSGRDSLALDAMEPFRAPLVDTLVVQLLTRKMLGPGDFVPQGRSAVYLTSDGRSRFLTAWEAWLRAPQRGGAFFGGTAARGTPADSWRQALRSQAVALRTAIVHKQSPVWHWDCEGGHDAGIEVQAPPRPPLTTKIHANKPSKGKEK